MGHSRDDAIHKVPHEMEMRWQDWFDSKLFEELHSKDTCYTFPMPVPVFLYFDNNPKLINLITNRLQKYVDSKSVGD